MIRPSNIALQILILSIVISLASCFHHDDAKQTTTGTDTASKLQALKDSVVVNGNITTTISTNIDALETILDLKTYKPLQVKYKYTFIDNSGKNERLTVPGPSDYSLEALLYFDSLTFKSILNVYRNSDDLTPIPNYNKEEFKFDWLDKSILNELEKSRKDYHGHSNLFLKMIKGKLWFLDKKILLLKWT